MSISNYTELQTAVSNWLDRSDLTSRIPEFIALAEAKINRRLRIQAMETIDTAFAIANETESLPTGFRSLRRIYINTNPRQDLKYLPTNRLNAGDLGLTASDRPQFYSFEGDSFRFRPTPNSSYTATLVYYKAFDPLATTPSNTLLTNHPDIYLYGSLSEAASFLMDNELISLYVALFDKALMSAEDEDKNNRVSGSELMPRPIGSTP